MTDTPPRGPTRMVSPLVSRTDRPDGGVLYRAEEVPVTIVASGSGLSILLGQHAKITHDAGLEALGEALARAVCQWRAQRDTGSPAPEPAYLVNLSWDQAPAILTGVPTAHYDPGAGGDRKQPPSRTGSQPLPPPPPASTPPPEISR